MKLRFVRSASSLTMILPAGEPRRFDAHNHATRGSKGPWPPGQYDAIGLIEVTGAAGQRAGSFGQWFLKFAVPGRSGMGIHAGREGVPDGLGRTGAGHATLGCIRTTHAAMAAIASAWDGSATLTVEG